MAILTPTGGLSDAGGGGQYQTSYDSLPYVSSRGFTAPSSPSEPPIDTGSGGGFVTRETQFNPRGLGTPGEPGMLGAGGGGGGSGGSGDDTNKSAFDKLLAAFGSLGGATGGGGGGGVLATQVPVQTSSSGGPSMTRLLLYGAIGVGIFFLGRKMGWW